MIRLILVSTILPLLMLGFILNANQFGIQNPNVNEVITSTNWPSSRVSGTGTGTGTAPGLLVKKVANVTEAQVGETITYTYQATNTGTVNLTITATDDPLGPVNLSPGTLAPTQSATGQLTYTILAADRPGPIKNTVTVTGTSGVSSTIVTVNALVYIAQTTNIVTDTALTKVYTFTGGTAITIPPNILPSNAAKLKYTFLNITPTQTITKGLSSNNFGLVFTLDLLDGSDVPIPNPTFSKPLTISVTFDPVELEQRGVNPGTLRVFFFNESKSQWEDLQQVAGSPDTVNNIVTFVVSHLTQFALVDGDRIYLPIIVRN